MEFRNILVPVVGIDTGDEDAIRLACRLAKKDKGKIWAVYVVTVKRTLPLEAIRRRVYCRLLCGGSSSP